MSEKNIDDLVGDYIKEVKKVLPEWLKNKKEHKEILADLEEHIWEKANELSDTGQATEDSVQMAIAHMGTPKSIAKEYKRRGTPKVYITKEMWPLYLRVLTIVFAVIIIVNIIGLIMNIVSGTTDLGELIGGLFSGIQSGLFISFAIISIIFVGLSMEGYFPEDFKIYTVQVNERTIGRETPTLEIIKLPQSKIYLQKIRWEARECINRQENRTKNCIRLSQESTFQHDAMKFMIGWHLNRSVPVELSFTL